MRLLSFFVFLGISMSVFSGEVKSFIYQLQNMNIQELAAKKVDLIVMDYSRDGTDEKAFSRNEIHKLQSSGKKVLAYWSIGEAEEYRFYFNPSWKKANKAPRWLNQENEKWVGNFKVRFWEKGWKDILLYGKENYLNRIISQGFNGVYLDLVDCYEFWDEQGVKNSKEEMIKLLLEISFQGKKRSGNPNFQIFIQNAELLLEDSRVMKLINGIGKESPWYNDGEKRGFQESMYSINLLRKAVSEGKDVIVTEYIDSSRKEMFFLKAKLYKFIPYISTRGLDIIGDYPTK